MPQFSTESSIAFLGIGLMGTRMSKRLLDAGFTVAVWNRTTSACDEVIAYGATVLDLQKITDYPIIMLCLADDHAVQAVVDQLMPSLQTGQIIIDFSSLSVAKTHALSKFSCVWWYRRCRARQFSDFCRW